MSPHAFVAGPMTPPSGIPLPTSNPLSRSTPFPFPRQPRHRGPTSNIPAAARLPTSPRLRNSPSVPGPNLVRPRGVRAEAGFNIFRRFSARRENLLPNYLRSPGQTGLGRSFARTGACVGPTWRRLEVPCFVHSSSGLGQFPPPASSRASRRLEVSASAFYDDEAIGAEHGEGFATFRPRGPLQVDVDYLNDRMQITGLPRLRFALRPDEAFGLIYSWDNVLADTRTLRLRSWKRLAAEAGKPFPESSEKLRALTASSPERAIQDILRWTESQEEAAQLASRAAELYARHLGQVRAPMEGVKEWLGALSKAGVPCAVASSLDRLTLLAALDRMKLFHFFKAFVSSEDGMESMAHRFLSAAVKLDRPPLKCVVFEDDPRGITAAHNCSMKAVALIGQHTAYELQQADLAVGGFNDLSVINLRRLFANRGLGLEFMEVQKMKEEKRRPTRGTTTGTIF